jgi:ATP phosphoribosyltransferase
MTINDNKRLLIGLPDGVHIKDATNKLLKKAGLNVSGYKNSSYKRKYNAKLVLPSGKVCDVVIDKPKDLLYSLSLGKIDIIITGSDYVNDFCLFHAKQLKSPFNHGCKLIESAHLQLNHLGYFGTQLGFIVKEDSPYDNLDELISSQDKIICYSEFPIIASQYLSKLASYKYRFGDSLPSITSGFSILESNPKVNIIYSHGATESKAAIDNKALIFDLMLSGKTYKINKLKILRMVGNPIFNVIYKRKDSKKCSEITEFVKLIETTVKNYPDIYNISRKQ